MEAGHSGQYSTIIAEINAPTLTTSKEITPKDRFIYIPASPWPSSAHIGAN